MLLIDAGLLNGHGADGQHWSLKASTSTILSIVFCRPPKMRPKCGGSSMCILKAAHCSVFIREKIPLSTLLMSSFCVKIAYSC